MPARTGTEFLGGLKDERQIWVGADRVRDVAAHPAFAGAARSMAELFDLQHEAAAVCLMPDPETGEPISVSHIIPRSRGDLERRHACLERLAEFSVGIMGRTPDYLNVTLAGFAGRSDEWGAHGNDRGAENLVAFQKEAARRDLSLTHTIVQPTIDKSRGDVPGPGDEVALHKTGETAHGIVVRGARVLATLAPFSDEVEVPRERVFIDANTAVYNSVMTTGWMPNIMQQTSIRAQTKLEFAWGLATQMAEAINAGSGTGAEMLGEIWSYAEMTRAGVDSAEQGAYEWGNGVWFPDGGPFRALRGLLPLWFPRVNEIIRLIGSHNLLAAPTSGQLADPTLRPLIDRFLRGAKDTTALQRARIFRLAWDFVGSGLASRGEQYERFYLASCGRAFTRAQTYAAPDRARRLIARFLNEELS